MPWSRSRSTGVITTSVKLSRWVSAGVRFMSVRSMTSQPKPASWSSSGFSTWLRSSSLMCFGVLPGELILNLLHRVLRHRRFR